MARKDRVAEPRSAVELADQLNLIRQLVSIADQQLDKAKTDLGVARVGLAELEQELLTSGIGSANGGAL